jgi:hypothetical protein
MVSGSGLTGEGVIDTFDNGGAVTLRLSSKTGDSTSGVDITGLARIEAGIDDGCLICCFVFKTAY